MLPAQDEIQMQGVRLDTLPWSQDEMRGWLLSEEAARADAFVFDRDRTRFLRRRGALKAALAGYLDAEPSHVPLVWDERGKPRLRGGEIRFSATASEELALFAFCLDREVGVDIEQVRKRSDDIEVARHFFSPAEVAELESTDLESRARAFLRMWTLKEALAKATGDGMAVHVRRTAREGEQWVRGKPWTVGRLAWEPGLEAAFAIEGRSPRIVWVSGACGSLGPRGDGPGSACRCGVY
jgi:4'-phosphopantetheinyl transferase